MMNPQMNDGTEPGPQTRYQWPKFALAAVIAAIVLAILWMTVAVLRLRESRVPNTQPAANPTNRDVPDSTNQSGSTPALPERLAAFTNILTGGDAVIGRKLFFEKPEANCGKCHKVGGQGGDTGPALDGFGSRQTREYILESLLLPNLRIPEGYDTVIVLLKNGTGTSGLLKNENESELMIHTPEDGLVKINKSDVQVRQKGASPMPEGLDQLLTRDDLRHLIEFVAGLKNP
jgi:putative heme-binding domain-containing protein